MKKGIAYFLMGLFIIAILYMIVVNVLHNDDFFCTPFYEIINMTLTVFVVSYLTYFLANQSSNELKLKDIAELLLTQIQCSINSEAAKNIADKRSILLLQRSLSNKITLLLEISSELKITAEIDYIKTEINKYEEIIGDNYAYEMVSKDRSIDKIVTNIDNKCSSARVALYKKSLK